MAWFKRIGLFLAVNVLVMVAISTILSVLGVKPYLTAYGLDYQSLMIFCLIWGMGGAFISLALSRVMAKWMMGVQIVPPDTRDPELREVLQMVHELSRAAHLPVMPEVGVYESPEVNAFATGPTKSRSLVAVSTGLLHRMRREEVKGVLAHEVAHIANGDMVTMTLIQGVVNAFVMFLARAIAYALTMTKGDNGEERGGTPMSYYVVQFVLEIVFMILGSMVVAWFSRYREYRADAGGARLGGRGNMIQALEGLKRTFDEVDSSAQPAVQALKISSRPGGIMRLFSTHPPLDERIERLKRATT
ncbi:MAG: protease HtpX [Bdellovibrionaceae bacterium]|nr:protease HtpX [Pseudobdellovibrionaceae bacterium]